MKTMKARYFFAGIILILFTFNNCATKNDIPDNKLINEIIIETIKQDSLDTSLPMSNKLINYYILKFETNSELESPLLSRNKKGEPLVIEYFRKRQKFYTGYTISSKDSIFIERQIDNAKNIRLDSIRFKDIIKVKDITNWTDDKYREARIYRFLMPIFNCDKTLAWIEVDYHCHSCGGGYMVILKKENDKWKKIKSYRTWMN
jgi:hypothetical protein